MADLVLGIATSHTPMLTLPAELWASFSKNDERNPELAFPPHGVVMSYEEGLRQITPEIAAKFRGSEPYRAQAEACQRALDELSATLRAVNPDVTVIIGDDQDEWFFEDNMPALSVYWGDTAPLIPREMTPGTRAPEVLEAIRRGYGDVAMDVPVASTFGRYLIEYLTEHEFDVAHMRYVKQPYGGRVARRYPTKQGELDYVRETPPRPQGLPHAFSFVVKRLFDNQPRPILPVFQNTCYHPNQPTPRRAFATGEAIAGAIAEWKERASVAVIASGGLSHFVVDENLDRTLLRALQQRDAAGLRAIPRTQLYSAASEALNWVALGGAMQQTDLKMELLDYVPVYRTPAGTGGGWAFARWR